MVCALALAAPLPDDVKYFPELSGGEGNLQQYDGPQLIVSLLIGIAVCGLSPWPVLNRCTLARKRSVHHCTAEPGIRCVQTK